MTLAILVALVASVGASAPAPAAPAFRALVVAANDRFHGAMSDAAEPLLESLGAESGFAVHFTHRHLPRKRHALIAAKVGRVDQPAREPVRDAETGVGADQFAESVPVALIESLDVKM